VARERASSTADIPDLLILDDIACLTSNHLLAATVRAFVDWIVARIYCLFRRVGGGAIEIGC
jgi:hypothetical protein